MTQPCTQPEESEGGWSGEGAWVGAARARVCGRSLDPRTRTSDHSMSACQGSRQGCASEG